MRATPRSLFLHYGGAVVAVVLATVGRRLLDPILVDKFPLITYMVAVVFMAWYGGFGPSLTTLLLGALAAVLFILQPRGELAIAGFENQVGLGLFLFVGLAVALLSRSLRAALGRVEANARQAFEVQQWLRTTLASIGDAVITTDTRGDVTFLNPVAQALTGWTEAEAVGQPLEAVFDIRSERTGRPAENPVARVLRGGGVGLGNHTILVARDGAERPIDDSAALIRAENGTIAGVVLIFRDVTERRQIERLQRDLAAQLEKQVRERTAELRESEERFRLLVEGTQEYAIFLLDPEGRVASWNPGAERIKGYRAEEVIGQPIARFYPPEDVVADKPAQALRTALAAGKYEEEGWRIRRDGSRYWASVVITALRDEAGKLRGFSKITRDMTERKRAEENARRLSEEQAARKVAEEAARQVRASEERLRLFVEHAPAAVAMFDRHMRYLLVSRRWLTDYHLGDQDLTGRSHYEVFPEIPEQGKEVHARALAGVVVTCEEDRWERPDGTVDWLRWEVRPWRDTQGAIGGILIFSEVITERKKAAEFLRQSEARFRAIVNQATAGIAQTDLAGRLVFVNQKFGEMLGYAAADLRERTIQDLTDPADRPRHETLFRRAVTEGGDFVIEMHYLRKDGTPVWVNNSVSVIRGDAGRPEGVVAVMLDITDRKRAEQTAHFLADASANLATLVDYQSTLQKVARLAVPFFADWCAVDMVDADGALRRVAVAHVDPAKVELAHELQRRFPPDPEAPTGAPHILRTGRPEKITEITDALLAEMISDPELLGIVRQLGLKSYMGVPLRVRDRTLGVLTFIIAESGRLYDDTDLAVAQDLAHRAGIAIENARLYGELRRADRLKDEFLAMLAHELRNPLAPIRNALHIIKQPNAGAEMIGQVREMAERQVQHMARLLEDLLDVSRISRGRIELRSETVEVAALVRRTAEAVRPLMEEGGHELTVTFPPQTVWVQGDSTRLEQMLTNLLHNAAKYTDPGGHIWLAVEAEDSHVMLRVRDTGIGIDPEMLPRIFDLFVQAERRLDRSKGGIGIGLTLVKKLVELHGGTIRASSAGPGQGSEFVVRLPARVEQPADRLPDPLDGCGGTDLPRRRILVVDDNVDAADSLAFLLKLAGQEIRVAYDGPTALLLAEAFRPEVVLLDIGMPGMDGYEVARRLRVQGGSPPMVLVALTGWGQEEDRRRSLAAGFDEHLVKPVEMEALHAVLADPKLAGKA